MREKLSMRTASALMHAYKSSAKGEGAYTPRAHEERAAAELAAAHLVEDAGPTPGGMRRTYRVTPAGARRARQYEKDLML